MSTLNKISLNGTTYDIGGGDANIYDIYIDTGELYYQYTCVDPEALKTCTKILASLSSGKPAFVFLKNKSNAYCQGLCAKEPITVTPGKGGTVDFTGWAGAVLYDSLYQSGYNRAKIDKPTFGFRYNEQGEATGIRFYFSSADISYIPTDGNFKTAFSPTQPYHPATKKYVDDIDAKLETDLESKQDALTISAIPPENPEDGTLWVDTNDNGVIAKVDQKVDSGSTNAVSNSAITNYVNGLNTYSTTETVIGTWVNEDGSKQPLYRKVVYLGNLPNASTKNIPHNISNLKMVTKFYGSFYAADYSSQAGLPYVVSNENQAYFPYQINMDINQTNIVLISGVDRSTYKGQVTIEYTKTTDISTSEGV